MAYVHLGGVRASLQDGNLRRPETSSQPRIVILGTASGGLSYELFSVTNINRMEREFGSDSEVAKGVHEAIAQGADNIACMRIGGSLGYVTASKSSTSLTVRPLRRDGDALSRYSLAVIGSRVLVYDTEDEVWAYDSNQELVINDGSIEVEVTGDALTMLGATTPAATLTDPTTYITLSDLATTSFANTATTLTKVNGSDGETLTLPQRYAALSQAYYAMDFADGDFIVPMGVYIDNQNLAEGYSYSGSYDLYFDPTDSNSALGYVWEYEYRGRLFTYFTANRSTGVAATLQPVASGGSAVKAVGTFEDTTPANAITLTARKYGAKGDLIRLSISVSGVAGPTVAVTNDGAKVTIAITDDGTSTYDDAIAAINADPEASKWVVASSPGVASAGVLTALAATALSAATTKTAGVGTSYLDPLDLVGEAAPSAVDDYFHGVGSLTAADSEFRAVNFAHQLASFCYHASTTWKALMGTISFKGPDGIESTNGAGITRTKKADWVGSLPDYTDLGIEKEIASGDDGSGILGNKFMAGKAGYRNGALQNASAGSTGIAYGGLILTKGASLPNGTERPYGILDTDEATDINGKPIDIGRHIAVTYDWVVHRNNFNNGTSYPGPINALLAGRYAVTPENEEAIGRNGLVRRIASHVDIKAPQENRLASIRVIGLRRETNFGLVLTSARTAAHPSSDFTDLSTMRSLNRELNGIFEICKRFIGKEYSPERLQALQTAIDAFLRNETANGFNQGAKASLRYTISDRILGKLTVQLRMVPPFSIRLIEVEASVAADESEL